MVHRKTRLAIRYNLRYKIKNQVLKLSPFYIS
jgi:hypothetical protein